MSRIFLPFFLPVFVHYYKVKNRHLFNLMWESMTYALLFYLDARFLKSIYIYIYKKVTNEHQQKIYKICLFIYVSKSVHALAILPIPYPSDNRNVFSMATS
jgi:hypothetical protein